MADKKEIIGLHFGDYIVISEDFKRNEEEKDRKTKGKIKYPSVYYLCKCKCGKTMSIKKGSLLNGVSTNCGCNKIEEKKSLSGLKFGKLLVVEEDKNKEIYKCVCDCGNEKILKRSNLLGGTKSCGCLMKNRYENKPMKNKFVVDNEKKIVYGYTGRKNIEFIFDLDDYDRVSKKYWKFSCGYIYADKLLKLHNFIMNHEPTKFLVVDHINRNPLDNRKENLRIISQQNNAINSSIGKNNTSGIIGVYFDNSKNKWRATLKIDGKQKTLFQSVDKDVCIIKRLEAELKYFGKEFAPQRHLFKQYGVE